MNFRLLLSSTTCLFRTFDDLQIENIHLFGSAGGQAVYQLGPDFQMVSWNETTDSPHILVPSPLEVGSLSNTDSNRLPVGQPCVFWKTGGYIGRSVKMVPWLSTFLLRGPQHLHAWDPILRMPWACPLLQDLSVPLVWSFFGVGHQGNVKQHGIFWKKDDPTLWKLDIDIAYDVALAELRAGRWVFLYKGWN